MTGMKSLDQDLPSLEDTKLHVRPKNLNLSPKLLLFNKIGEHLEQDR